MAGMKVNLPREERCQLLFEFKESFGEPCIRAAICKLGKEVKITSLRIESGPRCGAEQFEPDNSMSSAQFFNLWHSGKYFGVHTMIIPDGGEIASPSVGFRAVSSPVIWNWSTCD
jgi:hypothetical protein